MSLFICRWQDGDFSAVSAASRDEAMELLDEVGNADVAELQEKGDVPRLVAEKAVKERRRRAITEMPSHSDKIQ